MKFSLGYPEILKIVLMLFLKTKLIIKGRAVTRCNIITSGFSDLRSLSNGIKDNIKILI